MRFAVYGAGAIGAYMGAKLSVAGEDVALIARGPHLKAIRENGVRIRSSDGDFEARLMATSDPTEIGKVDVVVLSVKAHGLTAIAPLLAPMLGPNTIVLPAQNGIPWWYFQSHGGRWEGTQLESVDPGGIITKHIATERIVGCVVYPAATIVEPGIIHHEEGNRFSIGELDGSSSLRCKELAAAIGSSIKCTSRTPDIRAASITAFFSTWVIQVGTPITIRGFKNEFCLTIFLMK